MIKESIKEKRKEYYEKNKDKAKEYHEKNKEKYQEYQQEYRENNKEKRHEYDKERRSIKITCECGGKYTLQHMTRHKRSHLHLKFLNQPKLNEITGA